MSVVDDQFLDPTLRNKLRELGGATQQHRASGSNSLQLLIPGLLAGGTGLFLLALAIFGDKGRGEHETEGRLFIGAIATFFILIGTGFIYWSWSSAKRTIYLCTNGLVDAKRSQVMVFAWDEIDSVEVQLTCNYPFPGLLGKLFKQNDAVYFVHATEERSIVFADSNLNEARALYLALHNAAEERFIPITQHDLR